MTIMCDSLTLQQVEDDADFLRLEKTSDVDWLNFLNVDMPGLFPDIKKEIQDQETEKIPSTEEEDVVVSDNLVVATQTSIILADQLAAQANAASSFSSPSSHIPSENLFLPVSPSPSVGSCLNVPNPLAGRCNSPVLSITAPEARHASTPPLAKTTVVGEKRNMPPVPVSPSPSVASALTTESIAASPEPPKKKARVSAAPPPPLISHAKASTPTKAVASNDAAVSTSNSKKTQLTKVPAVDLTPKPSTGSTQLSSLSEVVDGDKKQDDIAPDSNMTEEEIEEEKR